MDVSVQIQANSDKLIEALDKSSAAADNLTTAIQKTTNASTELNNVTLKNLDSDIQNLDTTLKTVNLTTVKTGNSLLSLNRITFVSLANSLSKLRVRDVLGTTEDVVKMGTYLKNTDKITFNGLKGEVDQLNNQKLKRTMSLTMGIGDYMRKTDKITLRGIITEWEKIDSSLVKTKKKTQDVKEETIDYMNVLNRIKVFSPTLTALLGGNINDLIEVVTLFEENSEKGKQFFAGTIIAIRGALFALTSSLEIFKLPKNLLNLLILTEQAVIHTYVLGYNALVRFRAGIISAFNTVKSIATTTVNSFKQIGTTLNASFSAALNLIQVFNGLIPVLENVKAYVISLFALIKSLADEIAKAFANIAPKIISVLTPIMDEVKKAVSGLRSVIDEIVSVAKGAATAAKGTATDDGQTPRARRVDTTQDDQRQQQQARARLTAQERAAQQEDERKARAQKQSDQARKKAKGRTTVPPAEDVIDDIVDENSIKSRLKKIFDSVSKSFNDFINRIKGIVTQLRGVLTVVASNITTFGRGLQSQFTRLFPNLSAQIGNVFNNLSIALRQGINKFNDVARGLMIGLVITFDKLSTSLKSGLAILDDAIRGAALGLIIAFDRLSNSLKIGLSKFDDVARGVVISLYLAFDKIVSSLRMNFAKFRDTLILMQFALLITFDNLSKSLRAGFSRFRETMIWMQFALLITFNNLSKSLRVGFNRFRETMIWLQFALLITFDSLSKSIRASFNQFKTTLANTAWINQTSRAFQQGFANFSRSFNQTFTRLSASLISEFNRIKTVIANSQWINQASKTLQQGFTTLNQVFARLSTSLRSSLTRATQVIGSIDFKGIITNLTNSLRTSLNQFKTVLINTGWINQAGRILQQGFANVSRIFTQSITTLRNSFTQILQFTRGIDFKGAFSNVAASLRTGFTQVSQFVKGIDFKGIFINISNSLKTGFNQVIQSAKSINFSSLFNQLITSLRTRFTQVVQFVKGINLTAIFNQVTNSLRLGLTQFRTIIANSTWLAQIGNVLKSGFMRIVPLVTTGLLTALRVVSVRISALMLSYFPALAGFISRIAPLKNVLVSLFSTVGTVANTIVGRLGPLFKNAFSTEIPVRYSGAYSRLATQIGIVGKQGLAIGKTFMGSLGSAVTGVNVFSLFSPVIGAFNKSFDLLFNFQKKIVTISGMAAGLGGGIIVAKVAEMQQLESQIKAVTSSTEEFSDTQSYLKTTSNTLSIDIGTLSKSYIQLLNLQKSGLITTDEARSLAEGFANVAAKTGASSDSVQASMLGMSQALSAGVLQADEMQQMLEPLPGLMQAMDKASGEGAGGFKKLTYAGKVSSAMLKDTLIGAFKLYEGEAAKTAGNIMPMVTRMKNSFAQMAFTFNKPITMSAQPVIDGANKIMDGIGSAVTKSVSGGGFFSFIIAQFEELGVWLGKIGSALSVAFQLVDLSKFYSAVERLKGSLSGLFSGVFDLTKPEALARLIQIIVGAFANVANYLSGFISGISQFTGTAMTMYQVIVGKANPVLIQLIGLFGGVSKAISLFAPALQLLFEIAKIVALVGAFLLLQKVLAQTRMGLLALQIGFSLIAPGVAEVGLFVSKFRTQLLLLGNAVLRLIPLFLAFQIGQWVGEWLNSFESVRNLAYELLSGVLIVWAGIKAHAQIAAAFVQMIWQKAINGVSLVFATVGTAMAHPLDFVKTLWVNFVSFIRNLVSGFVDKLGSVLDTLDFLPGMDSASNKLKNYSQEMDKTTEEYKKLSLEGNAFAQEYQKQSDYVASASQEFTDKTIGIYRDFASERDSLLESKEILTGNKPITPIDAGGGQKTNQYDARRKAYEAELVVINEYKKSIKENQSIIQDSLAANIAYTESLTSMKDAAITDTISSMSDELDNFTKLVRLSNTEVTAGQTTNQVTYEAITRSVRKHYSDREAIVKQSVMTEEARAAAVKNINTELEQALADLEAQKSGKGGATTSPEIAIAKKQMEFSKQSIELEKQRMTVSVESANAIFTNNIKLIQMEGGTDAEKNKKIIAEQDKLLQAKISAAKKGYEAVSQNLKKSTDDYMAYSEKAISLEQAIRGEKESLADKLREAERKGMDESKAQSDLQSQITEKLTEAKAAMETGDAERAKNLADQAESLGGQLTATDAMKNVLIESSAIREELLTKEKATVDTQKQIAADRMSQETAVADQMKATYDALETDLADRQLRVNFDATQAEITINSLKEKLDAIKDKTVTVTVNSVENKAIGGFAGLRFGTGARVPGIGNSDTVPAMLTPGEFVVRKSRATRFAGLLNYVNFGSDNQVAILQNYLRDGIQRLNIGGPVLQMPVIQRLNTGGNVTDVTQPQMVPVANLYLSTGKPVTVYHPADTAASVVNALQGLSRGRL